MFSVRKVLLLLGRVTQPGSSTPPRVNQSAVLLTNLHRQALNYKYVSRSSEFTTRLTEVGLLNP